MSLWKRGNVWWAIFTIDGRRQQMSTGTSNRKQAELIQQKLKQEANLRRHRVVRVDPKMTFEALAAKFIANGGPRPHHLDRLKNLLPFFGETPAVRIDKALVRDYILKRQSEARKIKDSTINRDIAVLRRLLYWAVDESLLDFNPIARFRMLRERRTKKPVLTIAEEGLLLSAAPEHLREIVIAALDTGMRRGEILNQRFEDVDFERRLLFATKSKTPEGECREIPLTERVYELLSSKRKLDGLIFTFRGGNIRSVKTTWKNTLKKSGLRHIRFHDLRHTFNTRLMEAGVIQDVRRALMGHTSGDVHSRYTHVEYPAKRRAIQMLEMWCAQQIELQKGGKSTNEPRPQALPAGIAGLLPTGTGSDQAAD